MTILQKGAESRVLEARFDFLLHAIDSLTTQHELYMSEFEKDITYSHLVERPFPADKILSHPVADCCTFHFFSCLSGSSGISCTRLPKKRLTCDSWEKIQIHFLCRNRRVYTAEHLGCCG